MPEPIDLTEGQRLLDALNEEGTPDEWLIGQEEDKGWTHLYARHRLYNPDDGAYAEWSEYVARTVKPADAALIAWARNNLSVLLKRLNELDQDLRLAVADANTETERADKAEATIDRVRTAAHSSKSELVYVDDILEVLDGGQ